MIRYNSVRSCGTFVSAAVVFLVSSAWLAGGIGAQTAESAIAGSTLKSAGPAPFIVAPSIPLGYAPSSVATGDLRHSGKLDLVTTDYASGNITVFLGAGQGKFAAGVEYAAGPEPGSVLVADINGDGRPDVVVANQSAGTISVLLGKGDGTLEARQTYAVGFNPSFIVTGDFGGTGRVDVAVAGTSRNLLAILLNNGNGGLEKAISRSLSKTPTSLSVADFNNDGHADLALANTDGSVSILLGKGEGLFSALTDVSVASGSLSSIATGDFNKDGKIDLIVTQPGQKLVSVLLGKGDGTFASPESYAVGHEPVSAVVADVNGDGISDLVVINNQSNTFSVLDGNGDGTFAKSRDFVAGNAPLAAVAGDFYGSGHVDLAIINHSSQTVSIPGGNGDGTFKAARSYVSGQQPVSIASGVLNGGKTQGMVVANYCGSDLSCASAGNIAVFLPDASGAYRLSSTYTVGAGPVSVALADVNGDKNLDIVAANRLDKTVTVLLGVGDGTFRQPTTFPLAAAPIAIAAGDFNKDGKLDLAVLEDCGAAKCTEPGNVEILLGAEAGTFKSVSTYAAGYSPTSLAIGDINGDKKLDIVVANRCGAEASCLSPGSGTVLLGDGTGKFKAGTVLALGNSPSSIALGNLIGSGLDLIVSRSTDNTVAVLRGNGDGTFQAALPYAVGNKPGSLVVADFNGDGKTDVAVANVNDSTASVLLGNGDGTLQPATAFPVGSGPAALTAVGSTSTRHASLATANGNSESSSPGTEFSVLSNLQSDPPLASFTLVPSPTPSSNVNEGVSLTATLTGDGTDPAPSGTVTFESNANPLSDCTSVSVPQGATPADPSIVTCTTQMLTAGSDSLTAVYSGDTVYDTGVGETSPAVTQTVSQLSPTLTISPTVSSALNTAVTFTATLAGVTITPVGPTGTVAFTVGGSPITCNSAATVNPATGVATCVTSALLVGTDVIGASYPGDNNYAAATATTVNQTITKLSPTLTISPTTSAGFNSAVTLTATLAGVAFTPTGPSGTVSFTAGVNPITCISAATVNPATGVATCVTSALPVGTDSIGASYPGDGNYNTATASAVNQVITKLSPTLTISPTTSTALNSAVTLTATLSGVSFTPTGPSGTVAFTAGGAAISCNSAATVSPTTGVATCVTSALNAGTNSIVASYPGDGNYNAATAASVNQTITKLGPTLSLSPASGSVGIPVTLTATLSGVTFTPNGPTGTVSFSTGGNPIVCNSPSTGSVNSTTGVATCTTSALVVPADVVAATYNGDGNYNSAVATPITVSVAVSAATISFLPSSPTSGTVNQPLTFTVKVAPPGGGGTPNETVPTGSVTFKQGTTIICNAVTITGGTPATGTAGTAACTNSFASAIPSPGVTISATYSGDQNFSSGSFSLTPALTVSASGTTATLSSAPASSTVNQQVAFTAVVTPTFTGTALPTGTVTFTNNGTALPCSPVTVATSAGVTTAVCNFTFLSTSSNSVVAKYNGDANFTLSSSAADLQPVSKTATSTAVGSSLASPAVNQTITFTATVTPAIAPFTGSTNPTGSVAFSYVLNGGSPVTLCASAGVTTTAGVTTATCAQPLPSDGNYTISAAYSGDASFLVSTGTAPQPVGLATTTTALSAVPSTSTVNQSVTFTATVTPTISGSTNPTGNVTFTYTNSSVTTPVNLCVPKAVSTSAGKTTATCVASLPGAAADTITATYAGDTNFGSSSVTAAQTVNTTATTTAVTASTASPTVNQAITFTATITPAVAPFAGSTNPSGKVVFTYTLGAGPVVTLCASAGVSTTAEVTTATCSTSLPSNGSYTIAAAYTGDANFIASTGTAPESVGATATTTTLVSSLTTSVVNQVSTYTATIAPAVPGSTNPTGSVTFSYSLNGGASVILCTSVPVATVGTITSSTCTDPLPTKGPYIIKATYSGDSNFSTSVGTTPQTVNQASTTTTVVSSVPSAAVNQAVTFTATIRPAIAGATNPTGTVTFTSTLGGNSPVNLNCTSAQPISVSTAAGTTTAVCTASLPANGNYTITATYSGDTNFTSPAAGTVVQPVGLTATTTTVSSSLPSSFVNETVTFTATVKSTISGATNPSGSVAFTYVLGGGVPVTLCATAGLTQSSGVASCTAPLPSAGSYAITATYSGDTNFASSSNLSSTPAAPLTQTVNQPVTTVGLTSVPATNSVVNQSVTFTATINPVNTGAPTYTGTTEPTGTVTFTDTLTSTTLCTITVSSAGTVPPCTVAFSTPAANTVTATYSGDSNFPKTTSAVVTQTVSQSPTTTTVVSSSSNPSVNQPVTFTATVAPTTFTGSVFPTGTVTFSYTLNGAAPVTLCGAVSVATLGTVTTALCTAPLPSQAPASAPYTITATYSGDKNFTTGAGTTTQTVAGTATTTAFVSAPNPSSVNQPVLFTATVKPALTGSTSPSGTVAFTYSLNGGASVNLCAAAAVTTATGVATCLEPLPTAAPSTAPYVITAKYSGDANFVSSSNTLNQTVNPANLAIFVTSSQGNSLVNQAVTFTATLTVANSGTAQPTSTMSFKDTLTGATLCADATLTSTGSGVYTASCSPPVTNLWVAGTHPITATYNGDPNFPAATSPVFAQVVKPAPTTAALVSSLPVSIATETVTFTATVSPTKTGPIVPSGYFTFTSSGTWNPAASCQAAPVAPVISGTGAGTATATCTATFPASASNQTISAVYANDPNFTSSNSSVAQTVQNFTIANSVTSTLTATPSTGPVILTQGYSTATTATAGTDPFNPTAVKVVVTSTGGFTDKLNVSCVVTNSTHAVVTDPSCTMSTTTTPPTATTLSGATGTALIYTLSASASAPVSAYTVTLTANDNSTPALSTAAAPLTLYVLGVANPLSLAQGASGQENVSFNTFSAPSSDSFTSVACGTVTPLTNGVAGTPLTNPGVTCTSQIPAAGIPIISGGTTTVAVSISTAGTKTAELRRSNTVSMAAFLGIPLLALMGWVGSRKSPRRNFFRFLGLILLLVGVSYASGCGGSFTSSSTTTSTGIGVGNYLVQVVGTDQNGNNYYAAIPLDVSKN